MFLAFFFCSSLGSLAQGDFFLEPEAMIGVNSPNWSRFPEDKSRTVFALGVGKHFSDSASHWQSYYNFPSLSFSFFYSDLGSPVQVRRLVSSRGLQLIFLRRESSSHSMAG